MPGAACRLLSVCVIMALAAVPAQAQSAGSAEAPLAKGMRQVDEGDYDGAIVTLDAHVRQFAGKAGSAHELAQAYLYLGVAYLAKGHETSAKARFREALSQAGDLRLSTDKFAPRVVELFEKAREETRQVAASAPGGETRPKKGGSKALPILLGVGALGGGAAALAGRGGDSGGSTGSSPGPASAPLSFNGQLGPRSESAGVPVGPFRAGPCLAELSWSDGRTELRMFVVPLSANPPPIDTRSMSNTSSVANWTCVADVGYRIDLFLQEPRVDVTYQLRVTPPQ